jgi:predicted methyltransferase
LTIRILQGDCREVMRTLADDSVDAIEHNGFPEVA